MREPAPIVRGAGPRATGHAPAARCARPRRVRYRRARRPPERWTAPAGNPRPCATMRGRSRDAAPGRWRRAAAARLARRGAATDQACGRADPTAPARPAAAPRDRARAAWDWGCPAAGPGDCRSFLWRSAHARRAREAKRDQDQAIDILQFRIWKAADDMTARADRQRFPTSGSDGKRLRARNPIMYVRDTF